MHKFIKVILTIIVFTMWSAQYLAQGCSQCKAQIESSEDNGLSIGKGLNSGILLLMLSPYIIMLVVFRKPIGKFLLEFSRMWKANKS